MQGGNALSTGTGNGSKEHCVLPFVFLWHEQGTSRQLTAKHNVNVELANKSR